MYLDQINESITGNLKQYFKSNFQLKKLEIIECAAKVGADFFSVILISLVLGLCVLFLSIGFGVYLSNQFSNRYIGFIVVAGIYLVLTVLLIAVRNQLIKKPITNLFIRKMTESSEQ